MTDLTNTILANTVLASVSWARTPANTGKGQPPMKIQITNTEKLRAALDHVNGAASAHTASAWAVAQQATAAEAHLDALGIAKRDRAGAVRDFVSGARVCNAYTKKSWSGRAATRVRLTRGASGWFVTEVERATIGQAGGWARTLLTPEQRDLALTVFRAGFSVQSAPATGAA